MSDRSLALLRRGRLCLLVFLATQLACVGSPALAQQNTAAPAPAKRPRVGLVLAGGGARGAAHVGVLKVLEELRIPIDCIAGTSMGALVGGGYASGMPAREIDEFLRSINWAEVVGGVGNRSLKTAEQNSFDDATGSIEVGLKGGRIVTEAGLISTGSIEDVLRRYVAKARSVADFNKLPIPYRAVATDMLTGNMVVLDHGDIATAMRASMAIPGAFAPVITDQYVLSDGFVVRNIPVDVARGLCGDVVIVVNLAKANATREQLTNPLALVSRGNDLMMEVNERQQLQTLTDRDVRIDVDLEDISSTDFQRTPEIIDIGEKAARAAASRLARLSVSEQEYAAWRERVTVHQNIKTQLADVQFQGLTRVNPQYLRTLTKVHAGDTVDTAAISQDAARMSVLDDLESVEYRFTGDPDNPTLLWQPKEKDIGPDYLRPSVGVYAAGGGDLQVELAVQHVRRWLNSYGAQWRNRVQIGTTALAETSLYQPLDVAQTYFIEPALLGRRSLEDVYDSTERVARYIFTDLGGQIDFGKNIANDAQVRLGYWNVRRRSYVDTGIPEMPTVNTRDAGLAMTAIYDTRETSSFATHGTAAEIQYYWSGSSLGADRNWQRLEAAFREPIPAGKLLTWITAAGGTDLGTDLPSDRAFSLGGPQSFRGYAQGEVRARRYLSLNGDFLWHVADILTLASQSLYAGVSVQASRVYDRVDPVPNGSLYGASVYLGGQTPFGTLGVGVGKATGAWAGWITLGTPIGTGSILNQPLFR
jgi:NTE family protein